MRALLLQEVYLRMDSNDPRWGTVVEFPTDPFGDSTQRFPAATPRLLGEDGNPDAELELAPPLPSPPLEGGDGLAGVTRPFGPQQAGVYPTAKRIAMETYLRARKRHHTSVGAVEACVQALSTRRHLFPPTAPPADFDLLMGWVKEGGWESEYRATLAEQSLDTDPLERLNDLKASLKEAEAIATQLRQSCIQLPGANPTSESQVRKYQMAWKTYQSIADELRKEEDHVRKTVVDRAASASSSPDSSADDIFLSLIEQYGDHGTQYRILCQTLAQNTHKLNVLNASQRDVPVEEYAKLVDLNTKLIAQLQKYTEATRSQTVSQDLETLAEQLMHVVERTIGTTQPELFSKILRAVRTHTAVQVSSSKTSQTPLQQTS